MRAVALTVCFLMVPMRASAAPPKKPPNFVVIMADDLSAGELGCYGHPRQKTPSLDQLAKQGIRFRTCYATPNCSPTRMMLMTGRYGFRTGWCSFLERTYSPRPGTPQFDIGQAEITFADILKKRGYATGIAGKWQLPGSPANRIFDCGFDTYCMWMWKHGLPDLDPVTGKDRLPYDPRKSLHSRKKANRYWHPGVMVDAKQVPTKPDDYGPDIFTNFVCDFIRKHRSGPFVIYYPMALVHKHGGIVPGVPDLKRPGKKTDPGLQHGIEYMDHLVGRITRTIDTLGLDKNTYIVFTGDNGTAGAGKSTATERGARVPLIVRGPGVKPGSVTGELADLSDILPTLTEFAGGSLPKDRKIDGVSLVPTLLGRPGRRRGWAFSYLGTRRILRDKRWLLEGDGRLFDCGDKRDGKGYRDVTKSQDPEVVAARQRFAKILRTLPAPKAVARK
jgi:arylsulfatase A